MSRGFTTRTRLMSGGAFGAALLLALAGGAQAQAVNPDEAAEVDEVVVTGIRASLASSVEAKRRETSIVEVITAEDIGKLPDQSIAEAIARLPGLTAQRLDGRAQVISVRGLGPDFTTALLNGREQVTTGDNRGVEFDQYPSELLSSVVVYKTPDATLVGQGLAGTVDLRTVRPLAYGRSALAVNYRYEMNDLESLNAGAEDTGNRYSISFIDQFMDDTLGVALGYAHIESPYQNERYQAWGYPTVDCGPAYICTSGVPNPGYEAAVGQRILGGAKPFAQSSLLERDGYMGVLEWKPNDRFSTTFDAFYSDFDNKQILRGIEIPLWWGTNTQEQLQPGYTVEDGLITSATYTGVEGVVRNDMNTREASTLALGWNANLQLNDIWSINADVSHSKVERVDQIIESYSGTGYGMGVGASDTITYTIDDKGVASFDVGLDYTDPNLIVLTDPRGWGGTPGGPTSVIQAGYLGTPDVTDELNAVRLAAHGDIEQGWFQSVDFGVNFNTREKDFFQGEYFLVPANGLTEQPIPTACLQEPTTIGYLGFSMISYDTECVLDSGIYDLDENATADQIARSWEVKEEINTLFFQTNLAGDLGWLGVTGNIGFQLQSVKQTGSGFAAGPAPVVGGPALLTPISETEEYTELLPSMNLIFHVTDSDVVRFAAARTLARPRLDQMRGSQTVTFNPTQVDALPPEAAYFGGSGGNPHLRPWDAYVYDVSYEHYFAPGAYISVAAFYKDLRTYIYNQTLLRDYTGYTSPQTPASSIGLYTSPQNGEGGSIEGIELAASLPFGVFFEPLDGFGLVASYSDTSSDIQPDPGNPSRPLEGLSEEVSNVTLYYEKYGFQARVSNRTRSAFLGEIAGFGNARDYRSVGDESLIDAQIGYEFQSGPLEGLSVLVQGNNLTDEEFRTISDGIERRAIDYQVYGRTFLFGVNYRF